VITNSIDDAKGGGDDVLDLLTIGDELMEYSDIEYTMFLLTNAPLSHTRYYARVWFSNARSLSGRRFE
jgi:hypothetical protein